MRATATVQVPKQTLLDGGSLPTAKLEGPKQTLLDGGSLPTAKLAVLHGAPIARRMPTGQSEVEGAPRRRIKGILRMKRGHKKQTM